MWVFNHELKKDRYQEREDSSAVRNLVPIQAAVPCRTTVNKLIPEDIESVK